jgi:hypothetical protein
MRDRWRDAAEEKNSGTVSMSCLRGERHVANDAIQGRIAFCPSTATGEGNGDILYKSYVCTSHCTTAPGNNLMDSVSPHVSALAPTRSLSSRPSLHRIPLRCALSSNATGKVLILARTRITLQPPLAFFFASPTPPRTSLTGQVWRLSQAGSASRASHVPAQLPITLPQLRRRNDRKNWNGSYKNEAPFVSQLPLPLPRPRGSLPRALHLGRRPCRNSLSDGGPHALMQAQLSQSGIPRTPRRHPGILQYISPLQQGVYGLAYCRLVAAFLNRGRR